MYVQIPHANGAQLLNTAHIVSIDVSRFSTTGSPQGPFTWTVRLRLLDGQNPAVEGFPDQATALGYASALVETDDIKEV